MAIYINILTFTKLMQPVVGHKHKFLNPIKDKKSVLKMRVGTVGPTTTFCGSLR